jgi:hypothetical protein
VEMAVWARVTFGLEPGVLHPGPATAAANTTTGATAAGTTSAGTTSAGTTSAGTTSAGATAAISTATGEYHLQEEFEEGCGINDEEHEEEIDEDDDYDPDHDGMSDVSDTEIMGEEDEMLEELKNLDMPDTTSCTCCTRCSRRKGKTGRQPAPFHALGSRSGRVRRVTQRLMGVTSMEAKAIVDRLHRKFPDARRDPVNHLSWMTAIKTIPLGFNQVTSMIMSMTMISLSQVARLRLWLLTELTVRNSDLSRIPTARSIFAIAHDVMVPGGKAGVVMSETSASVPLQLLLDHTAQRWLMVTGLKVKG